ncbi:S-adenosyl-L-methionine-dependent methyltransferase [Lyophyllum atratum]|nr:S-adenosyl-L-methionine-dependent methyltransferase [Lyophyllum atratum]
MIVNRTQLTSLISLIQESARVVETEFQRSCIPDIPSLDDLEPHPFDTAVYSEEMRHAVQVLEGACAQLCATVARPTHTMLNFYEPACMHVVLQFKIPDILQKKPCGMHISEIGKISGANQRKLGRVLRLLASKHCFREISPDVFANNRLSLQLLSSNPFSSLALDYVGENYKWTSELAETLADTIMGHSFALDHCAFNKYTKYGGSFFDYLDGGAPGGNEYGARLGVAMVGWGVATEVGAVLKGFPWGDLPQNASICDVGGGVGTVTMRLAKAYSRLLYKLQDTQKRIQQAQENIWPEGFPEAMSQGRIEFKAMDFLIESPITDCDVYYLKNVIHDWPDDASIKILQNVRNAMAAHSRILIHEYIIQPACLPSNEEASHPPAPPPLLPNYGAGRIRQYNLDLDMMTAMNSQERTLQDYIRLGKVAGLRFVKLWTVGEMGIVELTRE